MRGSILHILDLHRSFTNEETYDFEDFTRDRHHKERASYKLLSCNDSLCSLRIKSRAYHTIVVLSTRPTLSASNRILLALDVPHDSRILVRHDNRFACICILQQVHDGPSRRAERSTWHISTYDLIRGREKRDWCDLGYFDSLHELGTNMTLDVIDGHFWVMTTEITHDREGPDPTSYYGGFRYDLASLWTSADSSLASNPASPRSRDNADAPPKPQYWRLWRRQQHEGPIHDLWTTLSLRKDEDDSYLVVESRREWQLHSKSPEPIRSFYSTKFTLTASMPTFQSTDSLLLSQQGEAEMSVAASSPVPSDSSSGYDDDDEDPTQNFIESSLTKVQEFERWTSNKRVQHIELPSAIDVGEKHEEFSLHQTLHKSYNPSSATFIDIVHIPQDGKPNSVALRMGSMGSKEITLWPGRDESDETKRMFEMSDGLKNFKAFDDARCIVFGAEGGDLVVVCFDPMMGMGIYDI